MADETTAIDTSEREIVTRFDKTMESDVMLELIDGKEPAVATTLKNAENVFKSYLYLKELYSGSASSSRVLSCGSISAGTKTQIEIPEKCEFIDIISTSADTVDIEINGNSFSIPGNGFKYKLPVIGVSDTSLSGSVSDEVYITGNCSYVILIG